MSALQVTNVTVRFGGVVAVNDVSISVPERSLHGLIGPNGAGKTTMFNACTGFVRPNAGRIELFGRDISGLGPAGRAQLGLGRTFQRMELFESLTVEENVALGREASMAGSLPWRQLVTTRKERTEVAAAAALAMERCGLQPIADQMVGALPTGTRRLVELARVLAGRFRVLLLDEPSSGLDQNESEHFGRILREAVTGAELTVLLVEHDMALVMEICDYIHVLDFGRLIFEGDPEAVQASEEVRRAYLGKAA
jgi:ABC-type branched-subunit amino acid transport system ATPase component